MRSIRVLATAFALSALLAPALIALPPAGGGGGGGGTLPPPADASVAFNKDGRLCLARADASGQTVIGSMTIEGEIAWAPSGGPIFVETRLPSAIYRINADGTGQGLVVSRAYSTPRGIAVTRGAPCPDGQLRLFYTEYGSTGDALDLWSARLDGTDRIRLTWNPPGVSFSQPTVSPTGDMVIVADSLLDLRLLTLGLVNGQLAVVASQSLIAGDPNHPMNPWVDDWMFFVPWFEDITAANPGGTRLLFKAVHGLTSTTEALYRMEVTAPATPVQLAAPQPQVNAPCTTRDGQRLYYTVQEYPSNRVVIFRANPDGSGSAMWADPGRRGNHRAPCTKP